MLTYWNIMLIRIISAWDKITGYTALFSCRFLLLSAEWMLEVC